MKYMSKREAVYAGMLHQSYLPSRYMTYDEEQRPENKVAFFKPEINVNMVVDDSLYDTFRQVPDLVKPYTIIWNPYDK